MWDRCELICPTRALNGDVQGEVQIGLKEPRSRNQSRDAYKCQVRGEKSQEKIESRSSFPRLIHMHCILHLIYSMCHISAKRHHLCLKFC